MKVKILLVITLLTALVFLLLSCGKDDEKQDTADKKYKIEFIVEGRVYDIINTTGKSKVKMPVSPEKSGYLFSGWYFDEGTWEQKFTESTPLSDPISSDITVYAKFVQSGQDSAPNFSLSGFEYDGNGTFHLRFQAPIMTLI